jgi:hypothetical protein
MAYRLVPDWENPKDCDCGIGETMLDAVSNGRIFAVETRDSGFAIEEQCDNYFALCLTPAQLYQLGTELRELAKTKLTGEGGFDG